MSCEPPREKILSLLLRWFRWPFAAYGGRA
jgi:hypothetical protein